KPFNRPLVNEVGFVEFGLKLVGQLCRSLFEFDLWHNFYLVSFGFINFGGLPLPTLPTFCNSLAVTRNWYCAVSQSSYFFRSRSSSVSDSVSFSKSTLIAAYPNAKSKAHRIKEFDPNAPDDDVADIF